MTNTQSNYLQGEELKEFAIDAEMYLNWEAIKHWRGTSDRFKQEVFEDIRKALAHSMMCGEPMELEEAYMLIFEELEYVWEWQNQE